MMDSPFMMPGAFMPAHDANLAFSRPLATPSFYAPPSPSAASALSSSFSSLSRASSTAAVNSRKRPRLDTSSRIVRTPQRRQTRPDEREAWSPAPLANTDYRIAGGLDTPCAAAVREDEENALEFEKDHRPNRYNRQPKPATDSDFPHTPRPDNVQSRKRRLSLSPNTGWGRTVWELTGGVAGKVINFCWNTAFHGFHAGGGRGYHMQLGTPTVTAADLGYLDTSEDVFDVHYRGRGVTPVPGGFPEEDLIEDYMSHPGSHQSNETPTQTNDPAGSSLKSNWVMVNEPFTDLETSPARKRVRPSTANLHARSTPRQSLAHRTGLQGRPSTGGASFASARASGASPAGAFRPPPTEGSGRGHKRSRSSFASPRRSELGGQEATPRSPDVAKFEKKLRRQDQRQDESMNRMKQQMQDMMKEVQQALAAKVEVYDDVEDEGYGEGVDNAMSNTGW